MKIQKASQDYLEAMLICKEKHGYIRSIDVAEYVGVTKASVSYSTKRLRENGYIVMDKDGLITLTEKGKEIADFVKKRAEEAVYAVSGEVMTEKDRETFYQTLDALYKNLQRIGAEGIPSEK